MHGGYQRHKIQYTLYSLFAIYHSNDEKLHHPNELHEILISRDLRWPGASCRRLISISKNTVRVFFYPFF